MSRPKKRMSPPCFQPGLKVRVKPGVADPDFPDMPLGGWTGAVKQVEQVEGKTTCLIEWDLRTLHAIHPLYRKRCERDGLECHSMWLHAENLEPDDGEPARIETPTAIVTKPLLKEDREDRVRMALRLSHDDPLPEVNHKNLLAYHRYLSAHLAFPFPARYEKPVGWSRRVTLPLTVTGLLRPDECAIEPTYGIIATGHDTEEPVDFLLAEIEVKAASNSGRLVRDYAYWFHNWQ